MHQDIDITLEKHKDMPPLHFDTVYATTWWRQFVLCSWRFLTTYWRYPLYNYTRYIITIGLGGLSGAMLWQTGDGTSSVTSVLNI